MRDQIEERIREYLADPEPRLRRVREAARKYGFLPLYVGWPADEDGQAEAEQRCLETPHDEASFSSEASNSGKRAKSLLARMSSSDAGEACTALRKLGSGSNFSVISPYQASSKCPSA